MAKKGRKPFLESYEDRQRERVKITNLVSRNKQIRRVCCICYKEPSEILHNEKEPYKIAFICKDCRKDAYNLKLAKQKRFDIREKLVTKGTSVKNFTDETIVRIVLIYMNNKISIQKYCDKLKLSRYQFSQILKRYNQLFPNQNIYELIKIKKQKEKLKRK